MATNNLRIIYQNLADYSGTTITANTEANSTTTPATNMQKDIKSQVWRSQTFTTNLTTCTSYIWVVLGTSVTDLGGVILPFCNLTPAAKIEIKTYSSGTPTFTGTVDNPGVSGLGTPVFTVAETLACPYEVLGNWNWGVWELGANFYSYGGGTYARVWVPRNTVGLGNSFNRILIKIIDDRSSSLVTNKYIEASRLVLGSYWEPKYNTSFGLSTTIKDLSAHQRTESGDLITNRGVRFNSMNFDLKWLTTSDRQDLTRILRGNGLSRPIFVSLFPDNSDSYTKEQAHQIYGKLSQSSPIQHPIFETYSTQIEIEEL